MISKNEWHKWEGGDGEMGVIMAVLETIVGGGQLEAKFQEKEWVWESETQLIREGYWYEVLSFDWVGIKPTQGMGK